jgi:hypothetical protein
MVNLNSFVRGVSAFSSSKLATVSMNGLSKADDRGMENGTLSGDDSHSDNGDSRDSSNLRIVADVPFENEARNCFTIPPN